jgi:hypothetical protein
VQIFLKCLRVLRTWVWVENSKTNAAQTHATGGWGRCAARPAGSFNTQVRMCAPGAGSSARICSPPRLSHRSCPRLLCGRLSTGSARSPLALHRARQHGPGDGDKPIGFIGLGNMGQAMATNILKAHGSAIVYDVRANVCVCVRARAASLGAREATPQLRACGSTVTST